MMSLRRWLGGLVLALAGVVGCADTCGDLQAICDRCGDPNQRASCENTVDVDDRDLCERNIDSFEDICR